MHHFQIPKQKDYLLPENLAQLSDLNLDFVVLIQAFFRTDCSFET